MKNLLKIQPKNVISFNILPVLSSERASQEGKKGPEAGRTEFIQETGLKTYEI